MSNQNIDELIAIRCQLGEPDAWEELVRRWHPKLWSFISRMLTDQASAEDVLQTVWLKVVRSLIRLEKPERLAGWLYSIARAAIADRLRNQYRQPLIELSESVLDGSNEANELIDIGDVLDSGLAQLHPADREVVVLYYLEERPLDEVAETCGIPVGTAKSRLYRSRKTLREGLEKQV